MSEVFSEIRYIPLETKPECLLNNISVSEYEDFFLVSSNDAMESIFLYSKEGMFLRKIGNKGRGPGEYIDRKDVKIIDNKVFVVSNFSRSIITYSIDGKFIKKYNLGFGGLPGSITKITDHSFFISLTNTCDLGRLILTDEDLVPINGFFKQNPIRYTPNPLSFPISNNKTYYYYSVVDTIFEITGGIPTPKFVLDHSKYNKPKNFISTVSDGKDDYEHPEIFNCGMSKNYLSIMIYYRPKRIRNLVLFRLSDKMTLNYSYFINDIDNGVPSNINGHLTTDNSIVYCLKAIDIVKHYEGMSNNERDDPKNAAFISLAREISSDSNPVLMICKLK